MAEYLETTYDKFIFRVRVGDRYSRDDVWARLEGTVATIGVTDFLQKSKGDVTVLETVPPGTEARPGDELGRIETIKSTYGIVAPLAGRVVEVNPRLGEEPYLLNESPYEDGWIYRIEVSDPATATDGLLSDAQYLELMKAKISIELGEAHGR
jgi:glycine cleavage system H protein